MIKIYVDSHCPHCKKLKDGLLNKNIDFIEIDVDLPENKANGENIFKIAGVSVIPIIVVGNNLLVPTKSFETIDQAIDLIVNLTRT